jgi:hypothetical protein
MSEEALCIESNATISISKSYNPRIAYLQRLDKVSAEQLIYRLLEIQNNVTVNDKEKIFALIQYHALANQATSAEARLVNLWISLESLLRGGSQSIIERICQSICPSIAIDNLFKLLRGLSIYIRNFWRQGNFNDFADIFPRSKEKFLDPEDLLDVLLDDEEGERINKLYLLTSSNPLILFRIFHLRKKILNNASNLAKNLKTNCMHLDWQIRRIYRARNDITHRAVSPPFLSQLIQHLHSYLLITITRVIHELRKTNNRLTINEIFEHRRLLFEYYIEKLNSANSYQITKTVIYDTSKILSYSGDDFAWNQ